MSSAQFLEEFLAAHGKEVVAAIHEYGAVLLRGFDVDSDAAFEQVISSLPHLRPMRGYFMAEDGRTNVGDSSVFHTNANVRTGGDFSKLGAGLHTENFYTTDFPAFQCFWCARPSWFGGETGLSHLGRAYAELDEELQARLVRDGTCTPKAWLVASVAKRYDTSEPAVESFFREFGLSIIQEDGERYVVLQKPVVVQHPHTGHKSLCANLSGELPEFCRFLEGFLAANYGHWRWALHRLVWRHPHLRFALEAGALIPRLLADRGVARYHLRRRVLDRFSGDRQREGRAQKHVTSRRLAGQISRADSLALATAVWRHFSVFAWRRGDVLIIDNLQIAHTGMPGLGPRQLRAMLCNAAAFRYPLAQPIAALALAPDYVPVDERMAGSRAPAAFERASARRA